ncbi:mitochondrial intermembrane space protein Mia40 [Cordyceps militaris CM01]|uniref:Mitochondrial intermembrane space import and assembly protein 40 n=1 Tax=Cordyceps militaris (strain CM01) TaxID=983644 RepID=G3JCE2_CORMM|nr:mitochondrial intermembrane space protein Mia40 [Cordyceps militaris CM01]EGX94603.1 mitochondrial intermembrane space protein Mia40 [Cordyceps militaris CM01]
MYRTTLRSASRPAAAGLRAQTLRSAPRRFASTSPADKSRSWKGSAVRWALAGGAVYYYSTSTVFAEEAIPVRQFSTAPPSFPEATESTQLPTVESIVEERKSQAAAKAQKSAEPTPKKPDDKEEAAAELNTAVAGSPAELEEEAGQEAAFNPETGEINWDCPCLGGMAHGPCGEEFKTAFSCFVYSEEEPKGMECIDKFQGMQECFRKYPEIYGAELAEADDAEDLPADLELPSDTQTLREGQAGEKQTLPEGDLATEKQIHHAQPSDTDGPAAPEEKTEKPAESAPATIPAVPKQETEERPTESSEPGPAAIPEASINTTSTTSTSNGPKWEDATDANKKSPEA